MKLYVSYYAYSRVNPIKMHGWIARAVTRIGIAVVVGHIDIVQASARLTSKYRCYLLVLGFNKNLLVLNTDIYKVSTAIINIYKSY